MVWLWYTQERPLPQPDEPVLLYTSAAHDSLRTLFGQAIRGATRSIHLVMYSFTEETLIHLLNQKGAEGVAVTVYHDGSTSQAGYRELRYAKKVIAQGSGLMHRKILIVDEEHVWIGSANFTRDSLLLHDNLVAYFHSPLLAHALLSEEETHTFQIGSQPMEWWFLPRDHERALSRLLELIEGATTSLHVAMYTWTHPLLTEAILRAHARGLSVSILLDRGQAIGTGHTVFKKLQKAGIPLRLGARHTLLHHKLVWIDKKVLVSGSTNWTQSAFLRNEDGFFILHDLTEAQQKKMELTWSRTWSLSHLPPARPRHLERLAEKKAAHFRNAA